jgi:glutaredoxin
MEKVFKDLKTSNTVFYFSKAGCPYCEKLAKELSEHKIPFQQIKIDNVEHSKKLKELTGMSTFPMLYIGSTKIGGFSDFYSLLITNQLSALLNSIGLKNDFDF